MELLTKLYPSFALLKQKCDTLLCHLASHLSVDMVIFIITLYAVDVRKKL